MSGEIVSNVCFKDCGWWLHCHFKCVHHSTRIHKYTHLLDSMCMYVCATVTTLTRRGAKLPYVHLNFSDLDNFLYFSSEEHIHPWPFPFRCSNGNTVRTSCARMREKYINGKCLVWVSISQHESFHFLLSLPLTHSFPFSRTLFRSYLALLHQKSNKMEWIRDAYWSKSLDDTFYGTLN